MELLLIRHARPERVEPGGGLPADPGLTAEGRQQAHRLADWLAHERIDRVLASPARRATETAAPLADALGVGLDLDDGLAEFDAAADHYIPLEELRREGGPMWNAMVEGRWYETGGLTPERFRAQVLPALAGIVAAGPGTRVAAVCHGGVINVYLADVLGLDVPLWFYPGYTSVSRVLVSRGGVRSLTALNETAHLLGRRER